MCFDSGHQAFIIPNIGYMLDCMIEEEMISNQTPFIYSWAGAIAGASEK
jgi:hypothetical protein